MPTVTSPLIQKLSLRVPLSDPELTMIERFERRRRIFLPGQEVVPQGLGRISAFILSEGWTFSYKILPAGHRQIIEVQIPGDFLGVRSILFQASDHSIEAVTRIEASEVMVSEIADALMHAPRLATAILWAAARDEAMVVEHLVNVGQRSATERTAHFLLELGARLTLIGVGDRTGFDCPLTQTHLADALGLTTVHVNRVLRDLRKDELLKFKNGRVVFIEYDKLKNMASFDRAYLDQEGPWLCHAKSILSQAGQ